LQRISILNIEYLASLLAQRVYSSETRCASWSNSIQCDLTAAGNPLCPHFKWHNIGRVLKYSPGCFEVLLCRSFMIKKTAQ